MIFTKVNAGGNDFICVDNTDGGYDQFILSDQFSQFLINICKRGLGVGADGLIFAEKPQSDEANIRARFFEPDGTEVELCGNGTACFIEWVISKNLAKGPEIAIETAAGITFGKQREDGSTSVCIPDPFDYRPDQRLCFPNCTWSVDYIVTGTGHAIAHVEHLETMDVAHWGKAIRHHESFDRPVNCNFVKILSEGHIAVRTFEFGVEAETLACGTGSASAAMLTARRENWDNKYLSGAEPVLVDVRGGVTMKVWLNYDPIDDRFHDVCLATYPHQIYSGELLNDLLGG